MIEIQNYAPFIQLAVAFDFACVTFSNERKKIQKQIESLSSLALDLIHDHQAKISRDIKRDILNPILTSYENKLISRQRKISEKLKSLPNMDAHFLGPVSLVAGIYSTIVLLLIGEIDKSKFLVQTYTYFTELTFVILFAFIIAEFNANYKSLKNPNFTPYKYTYLIALIFIILSIITSLVMAHTGYNFGTLPLHNITFTDISHYSLIIPFISFLGVLLWLFLFTLFTVFFIILSILTRWNYALQMKWFRLKQVICLAYKYINDTSKYKEIKIIENTSPLDSIYEQGNNTSSLTTSEQHNKSNHNSPVQPQKSTLIAKKKRKRKKLIRH